MNSVLFLFLLLHVTPVVLAVVGLALRFRWLHGPAVLVLASEVAGMVLAKGVSLDGMVSAEMAWMLAGPVFLPFELAQAMGDAPLWVLPLLAVAAVTGVIAWRLVSRRWESRLAAVVGVAAGFLAMWAVAEVALETTMRTRAAQQFASHCNFRRELAPTMLASGLSDFVNPSHGGLTDGANTYLWSFRESGWVKRDACEPRRVICTCR